MWSEDSYLSAVEVSKKNKQTKTNRTERRQSILNSAKRAITQLFGYYMSLLFNNNKLFNFKYPHG